MTYRLIKALIAASRTEGLAHKVDVYYAAGKLTDAEYTELAKALGGGDDSWA